MKHFGYHYLAGQWIKGQGVPFYSINPITNLKVWEGNQASIAEISLAESAAHGALFRWANLSIEDRGLYLYQFAKEVEKRRLELTELIALETGKPLWEAATEVSAVMSKIPLSIKAIKERRVETCSSSSESTAYVRYKPHGVVAVLGAFNFPAHLSNAHIVPALLAGNTVIYKPSELTPAVAECILQCWHASGIPAGVINGVQGDATTGQLLLSSQIQGVFFTGSYRAGQQIHNALTNRPDVILALEMGGNNPLVIDEVDDISAALYNTILSTLITAGQRCTCARRVFIKDDAAGDQFLIRLIDAYKKIKVGAYTDKPEPFMGPVIRFEHAIDHLRAQQELIDLNGNPIVSMKLLQDNSGLLSPGIIDMTHAREGFDEEIFGPLTQIYRYRDFEHALTMANATRYGLSAGLLSNNAQHYQQFYQTIKAGLINWNRPTTGALSNLPFGGVGFSGNHRPSAYFAADYCSYPIASLEQSIIDMPEQLLPGIELH